MKSPSRNAWLFALVLAVAAFAAVREAGNADYWRRYLSAVSRGTAEPLATQVTPRVVVKGVAGNALPEATPEAEGLHPQAVSDALDAARQQGARALVVHRRGHRVAAWFGKDLDGSTELAGGQLSPTFLLLATGVLADARQVEFEQAIEAIRAAVVPAGDGWRNPWSDAAREQFTLAAPPAFLMNDIEGSLANTLSLRVWQPLGAGDAYLWGQDDARLRLDCCAVARLDDWMRVGDVFLRNGEYGGSRIVSADWMRHLLAFDERGVAHPVWIPASVPWVGDEPPAEREAFWFDLAPDVRLWLLPRRGLSILHWAAAGSDHARDTAIPNILVRGITEQSTVPGAATSIGDLVPGH